MPENKNVIVFGATSYLGQFVVRNLLKQGCNIFAVTRDTAKCSILLADFLRDISVSSFEKIRSSKVGEVAAVINLAYIKDAPAYSLHKRNKKLIAAVHETAAVNGAARLIHISTQAVFGYSFDRTPRPVDASLKCDDSYVETKILAEHMLRKLSCNQEYSLSIVRLGNLIGAGALTWIALIAQKILEGKPVGFTDRMGHSNSTYAKNCADYISFLTGQSRAILNQFGPYHHLAEFHDCPWSKLLEFMSQVIGRKYVLVRSSDIPQLDDALGLIYKIINRFKEDKLGGLVRRTTNRLISEDFFARHISPRLREIHLSQPHIGAIPTVQNFTRADFSVMRVMAEQTPLEPHVLPGWSAPHNLETALSDIGDWLKNAGYVI